MTSLGDTMHAFSYVAYILHDRAGTLASLLYKAEKPSVCLSVCLTVTPVTQSSLYRLTWDLVCVELWSLACAYTFQ